MWNLKTTGADSGEYGEDYYIHTWDHKPTVKELIDFPAYMIWPTDAAVSVASESGEEILAAGFTDLYYVLTECN